MIVVKPDNSLVAGCEVFKLVGNIAQISENPKTVWRLVVVQIDFDRYVVKTLIPIQTGSILTTNFPRPSKIFIPNY